MTKKRKSGPAPAQKSTTRTWGQGGWADFNQIIGMGRAIVARIGEAEALRQSALMAAVDVIAQDISKTTLRLYQGYGDTRRVVEHSQHPWAHKFALDPNRYHHWGEFTSLAVAHLCVYQNSYIFKKRASIADTEPDLIPIHPLYCHLQVADDRFFFDVSSASEGMRAILGFAHARLTADQIIHIRMRQWDGIQGLSTLVVGSDVLGLNQMVTDFQAAITKSGMRPGAVIEVPELLDDDAFKRLKEQVTAAVDEAVQKGKPLVLEQGSKYNRVAFDATEMDLVKTRTQMHQEVARLFRMPPYKIGLLESIKAENLGQMEQAYVDDTLVPICRMVEQALSRDILSEEERLAGFHLEYDRDELYDRDPAARRERVENQFRYGIITRGQANVRLGYPPVAEELDHYVIPVNQAIQRKDGTVEYVTPNAVAPDPAPQAEDPPKKGFTPRIVSQ